MARGGFAAGAQQLTNTPELELGLSFPREALVRGLPGGMASGFLVRVRGKDGMWRVGGLEETSTIAEVKGRIQELKGIDAAMQRLSLEPTGGELDDRSSLSSLGLSKGDILHIQYEGSAAPASSSAASAPATVVKIDKGQVVTASGEMGPGKAGGPSAMRDIKKQWKWHEFMDLAKAYEFVLKDTPPSRCKKVTLDTNATLDFIRNVRNSAFQTTRIAWMFGFFTEESEAVVVALYEPPQEASVNDCM
jgi:hypothetical protein